MEMTIRPMTPQERKYSYNQTNQIGGQTGCIGHLRADMDSSGDAFFSSWEDHFAMLKTEEFKAELDEVINSLRFDPEYGDLLKDRGSLSKFCDTHPESSFGNRREYGVRVDTEKYTYLLRLNPHKGEYNLYCYCYTREWLDRHMRHAERGIRFITPSYAEKFRISDGEMIRIKTVGGEFRDRVCRYVDDCHMELSNSFGGSTVYHICEFAERLEQTECTVIPLRSSLPEKCFSVLESTGALISITKGVRGYAPAGARAEDMTPCEGADRLNEAMGVTKAQEAAMVAGSMFGWETPAADPKNYDSDGKAVKPKHRDRGDAR